MAIALQVCTFQECLALEKQLPLWK